MAQIQSVPLGRFPVSTVLSYGKSVQSKIDSLNLLQTDFKPHYNNYKSALQDLDNCNIKTNNETITKQLDIIGRRRSKIRSSISSIILANTNSNDASTQQAAERLVVLNKIFKDVAKKSFFQQISLISDFVKSAESDTYKTDIAKLNLTEWVTYLNETNNEYANLRNIRVEEKGSINNKMKAYDAKKSFITAHDILVKRLNALANVNGETQYIELFSFWNALIDELRISISSRFGSGKGGKPTGGNSNKPDSSSGPVDNGEDDRPVIE